MRKYFYVLIYMWKHNETGSRSNSSQTCFLKTEQGVCTYLTLMHHSERCLLWFVEKFH